MRLNLDCVRDILLCVEEHTGPRSRCMFVDTSQTESLKRMGLHTEEPQEYQINLMGVYEIDEIVYHVKYCHEADLIVLMEASSPYLQLVSDLTPKGHDFLANIRNDKIWANVKEITGKVGAKSLSAAVQIASSVITLIIKSHLGLS